MHDNFDYDPIFEFAGGYLHEDWREDYNNFEDVLKKYMAENSQEDQIKLAHAFLAILEKTKTEEEFEDELAKHGWQETLIDGSLREFIQELAKFLLTENS